MAFDPPIAFNNGDPLTQALANQYMVDNVQFLHDNLGILDSSKIAYSELSVDGVFDFQNLPQDYDDLTIVALLRGSTAAAETNMFMRFNGDAGAAAYGWYQTRLHGGGETPVTDASDSEITAQIWGNSATAGYFASLVIHIPGYSKTVNIKMIAGIGSTNQSDLPASIFFTGLWFSTSAIDRIQLSDSGNNFVAGSRVAIYAGQHLT